MHDSAHFTTTHVLVAAVQGGEAAAFQTLIERYFFVGKAWLERKPLPPAIAAGDILGDVFRDFLTKPELLRRFELRETGSFRRFFFTVLKNRWLYAFRQAGREKAAAEALAAESVRPEAEPDDEENAIWRTNLVRRAIVEWTRGNGTGLGGTPASTLFREIYLNGKPLKDAAVAAGLTLDQAKKLHGKGKREIKGLILELLRVEVADDAHYFEEVRCLFPLGEAPDPASCPSEDLLRDHLKGILARKAVDEVAAHIASCPFCLPRVHALERQSGVNLGSDHDKYLKTQ